MTTTFKFFLTSFTVSEQWSVMFVMQEFEAEILDLAFSRVCFGRVKDCFG